MASDRLSSCTNVSDFSKYNVWVELENDFNRERSRVRSYQALKQSVYKVPLCPEVERIENEIFCILENILEKTLEKAIETKSLKYHKTPFNAIDFIAEQLWNMNPYYPERQIEKKYLFDMDWVVEILETNPRPYFPFSYIWTQDYAAIKIQAFMRGYWVRRLPKVQEVRQFWKVLKKETDGSQTSRLPSILWPCLPFYRPPHQSFRRSTKENVKK